MKLVIATLVLLFYQFLAGFMPSLLRATVMICLAGTCILLDRDHEPLNLLALSGAAILLADPFQASSLSFQLSYLALGGILILGPPVHRVLEGRLPKAVLTPLAMSLGAQIATFPIVIARFGTWYPSGLLASLILVPLTTALLWAGLGWLVIFLIPWPQLHDLGARVLGLLYESIEESARVMGLLPGVSIDPRLLVPAVCVSAAAMLGLAVLVPPIRRPALSAAS
jgi:competence protein ComEC